MNSGYERNDLNRQGIEKQISNMLQNVMNFYSDEEAEENQTNKDNSNMKIIDFEGSFLTQDNREPQNWKNFHRSFVLEDNNEESQTEKAKISLRNPKKKISEIKKNLDNEEGSHNSSFVDEIQTIHNQKKSNFFCSESKKKPREESIFVPSKNSKNLEVPSGFVSDCSSEDFSTSLQDNLMNSELERDKFNYNNDMTHSLIKNNTNTNGIKFKTTLLKKIPIFGGSDTSLPKVENPGFNNFNQNKKICLMIPQNISKTPSPSPFFNK